MELCVSLRFDISGLTSIRNWKMVVVMSHTKIMLMSFTMYFRLQLAIEASQLCFLRFDKMTNIVKCIDIKPTTMADDEVERRLTTKCFIDIMFFFLFRMSFQCDILWYRKRNENRLSLAEENRLSWSRQWTIFIDDVRCSNSKMEKNCMYIRSPVATSYSSLVSRKLCPRHSENRLSYRWNVWQTYVSFRATLSFDEAVDGRRHRQLRVSPFRWIKLEFHSFDEIKMSRITSN